MKTARLSFVIQRLQQSALRLEDVLLPDAELLERFLLRRDCVAFEAIVRRHGPMVLGVSRRILRNDADAQDAFQATFLVLVRRAHAIRPGGKLCNWLYGVARNCALKARAMNRKRQVKEREAHNHAAPHADRTQSKELQQLLDTELATLPEHYRTPILLCDLEGMTIKEAALQLGCPAGTMATRLRRGRTLLAKRLARAGLTVGAASVAALLGQGNASALLPPALLAKTLALAMPTTVQSVTMLASLKVTALCEGVLKTMLLAKLKAIAAVLVAVILIFGAGAALFNYAHGTPADDRHAGTGKQQPGDEVNRERAQRQKALNPSDKDKSAEHDALASWKEATLISVEGSAGAGWSPDGQTFAVLLPKKISIYDRKNMKVALDLEQADALGLAFSPDGKLLATSHGTPAKLVLWDLSTGKPLATRGLAKNNLGAVAFSPDGNVLATSTGDTNITFWSVKALRTEGDGVQIRTIRENAGSVRALAYSRDGHVFAAASFESCAKLFEPATGKQVGVVACPGKEGSGDAGENVLAFAFSPSGKLLATANKDGTVALAEIPTGKLLTTLKGHTGAVTSVAFSPDGKTIASAGEDKTARLWDIASEKEIAVLKAHTRKLSTVAFSPDGKYLMTAGDDAVRLWVHAEAPIVKGSGSPPLERVSLYDRLAALPGDLIKNKKTDDEIIDALYLAALKRLPTDKERQPAATHFENAKDRAGAGRDLLWSLANSLEFLQLYGLDGNTPEALKELNDKLGKALERK
jgi:RNA polymerase sigma factor (sigma-70 family)